MSIQQHFVDFEKKMSSARRWCIWNAIFAAALLLFAGYLFVIDETGTAESIAFTGLLLATSTALTARTLYRVNKAAVLTAAVFFSINAKSGQ